MYVFRKDFIYTCTYIYKPIEVGLVKKEAGGVCITFCIQGYYCCSAPHYSMQGKAVTA